MDLEKIFEKAKEFESRKKKEIDKAWKKHKEFLQLFPFRQRPEDIDLLTPEKIYNPGPEKEYFIRWIEFKLRDLGHIRVGSAFYAENARKNIEKFKDLLRTVVNDSITIREKIDAHWEDIKGWGGDKIIAKKIIFCYYPEDVLPIFKTDDLEYFAENLQIDFRNDLEKVENMPEIISLKDFTQSL